MAKRRKKTSKNVPAKGRLKDMADQLWAVAVKEDWGCRCAVCGRMESLDSHHLVPRQHQATRYELRNGICLCKSCHQFDKNTSPHQNAAGWLAWLASRHPQACAWYHDNRRPKFEGTTNVLYYIEQIKRLREYVTTLDFERIVGVRFAAYLTGDGE